MENKKIRSQERKEEFIILFLATATFLSTFILLFTLAFIFKTGSSVISVRFLTTLWSHSNIQEGGIVQALLGTALLGLGIVIFAVPLGVATAIYLQEYAQESLFLRLSRLAIRNLAGVPSIIYGLFGLALFVLFLNFGTSLLAAILTLGCLALPYIITTSQEALKAVPNEFREGSFALGATQWQTIRKNVLPPAFSGIITGSLLGVSRAIGETAPLILVGATFYMNYLPTSLFDKFMALPYHIFILATQHASPDAEKYALGTALVLLGLVIIVNGSISLLRYRLRKKKEW